MGCCNSDESTEEETVAAPSNPAPIVPAADEVASQSNPTQETNSNSTLKVQKSVDSKSSSSAHQNALNKSADFQNPTKSTGDMLVAKVFSPVRGVVSGKKLRFVDEENHIDLDLTYIEERVIAMGGPYSQASLDFLYRNPLEMCHRFFEMRHKDHFAIYDLRGRLEADVLYPSDSFADIGGSVVRLFAFEDHSPCSISKMIGFCKHVSEYLESDPLGTVAVHCKAGKGRTGVMCAALFMYEDKVESAQDAIDLFSALRTADGKTVNRRSQIRFLHDFYDYYLTRKWPSDKFDEPVKLQRIIIDELPGMDIGFEKCEPYFRILDEQKNVVFDLKKDASDFIKSYKNKSQVIFESPKLMIQIPILHGCFCVEFWDEDLISDDFMCLVWLQSGICKENKTMRLDYKQVDEIDKHKMVNVSKEFAITFQFGVSDDQPSDQEQPTVDSVEADVPAAAEE